MNWASHAIELLQRGEPAVIHPTGNSMQPRVRSGAKVTLVPYLPEENPTVDSIVLVKCKGRVYLHLIKAIRGPEGNRSYQIGNNHGGINGWVSRSAIYGRAVDIQNP